MIIFIAQLQPILFTDHNFRPLSIYYLNSITTIGVRACDIVVMWYRCDFWPLFLNKIQLIYHDEWRAQHKRSQRFKFLLSQFCEGCVFTKD